MLTYLLSRWEEVSLYDWHSVSLVWNQLNKKQIYLFGDTKPMKQKVSRTAILHLQSLQSKWVFTALMFKKFIFKTWHCCLNSGFVLKGSRGESNVSRCGEISPFWKKNKSLGNFRIAYLLFGKLFYQLWYFYVTLSLLWMVKYWIVLWPSGHTAA